MKLLVTPEDQTVTQALQEALAIPDLSIFYTSSANISDINKMRLWVFTNIKQDSDEALHGVSDYWQTSAETLDLKSGDCEDFAILLVSMMRAHGVPQDQVYVTVGNDPNNNWHAFVIEKYSYGAWVEFDPQTVDDAVLLDGGMPLPYDVSYCFNDQGGFDGSPGYPVGYNVPTVSISPVRRPLELVKITSINPHDTGLDEAKLRLGEVWLPTYLPQGYVFSGGSISSTNDYHHLSLLYNAGAERALSLTESNNIGVSDIGPLDPATYEQIIINNKPAYFGVFTYTLKIGSSSTTISELVLSFIQGNLEIRLIPDPADSLSHEELIKIAESMTEY
jgi:hypothetical protein